MKQMRIVFFSILLLGLSSASKAQSENRIDSLDTIIQLLNAYQQAWEILDIIPTKLTVMNYGSIAK